MGKKFKMVREKALGQAEKYEIRADPRSNYRIRERPRERREQLYCSGL
jgi:hypothetical protein